MIDIVAVGNKYDDDDDIAYNIPHVRTVSNFKLSHN